MVPTMIEYLVQDYSSINGKLIRKPQAVVLKLKLDSVNSTCYFDNSLNMYNPFILGKPNIHYKRNTTHMFDRYCQYLNTIANTNTNSNSNSNKNSNSNSNSNGQNLNDQSANQSGCHFGLENTYEFKLVIEGPTAKPINLI